MTVKISGPIFFGSMIDEEQIGTDGNDIFVGGFGVDGAGDAGNDTIRAGAGDDLIFAAEGADLLDGGDRKSVV